MSKLRPVGTRFEVELPVPFGSTDLRARRLVYEVVGYVRCLRFYGDAVGEPREVVKLVSHKYLESSPYAHPWS